MQEIEKAIIAANFYDRFKDSKDDVKQYLSNNTISNIDAMLLLVKIRDEIISVQDMLDIVVYGNKDKNDQNNTPKTVEIIIGRPAIEDAVNMTAEKITDNPSNVQEALKVCSMSAYKYQLKFAAIVFEEMINDNEIWEEIVLH